MRQLRLVYEEIGTACWAELMGHPLLAELIDLQQLFTLNDEILVPRHHIHQTPRSTGRTVTVTDRIFFERWHCYTISDCLAMTSSCVFCRSSIGNVKVLVHDGMSEIERV